MTSKTFNNKTINGEDARTLTVDTIFGVPRLLLGSTEAVRGFGIAPSDAPALCLAILEAAGYTEAEYVDEWPHVNRAVFSLRLGIEEQEREASRAKEQAELESEALELFNAAREEIAVGTYGAYEQLDNHSRRKWLAVARKAREMAKESTK